MKIGFRSPEFDDAVAAVCHGSATDEQARALNESLRNNADARDEYILRLELHSRLASEPDLFAATDEPSLSPLNGERGQRAPLRWAIALAACLALLAIGW
jgi:GrpB-like predicted nucleotidyltransferase (UPF0157 family)